METTEKSGSKAVNQYAVPVLITGATGNVGRELINTLSGQGVRFRAMVRSRTDAKFFSQLPGGDAVLGDFNDPASLAQALQGIRKAFLLTPSSKQAEVQQLHFVEQAQQAGVQHIVKLSQLAADVHSPVRFLRYHAIVEQAIQQSGMAFTFLRPNLFMQGLLGFRQSIAEQGEFFAAIGEARISMIDVRDIAAVAAVVLTQAGHEGNVYTLTGPQALSHTDVADQLTTALGHPVQFVDIPPAVMRAELTKAGFPDWQADGLIEDYAHYARGEAALVSPSVQEVTGKPPRSCAQFAQDYAPIFG